MAEAAGQDYDSDVTGSGVRVGSYCCCCGMFKTRIISMRRMMRLNLCVYGVTKGRNFCVEMMSCNSATDRVVPVADDRGGNRSLSTRADLPRLSVLDISPGGQVQSGPGRALSCLTNPHQDHSRRDCQERVFCVFLFILSRSVARHLSRDPFKQSPHTPMLLPPLQSSKERICTTRALSCIVVSPRHHARGFRFLVPKRAKKVGVFFVARKLRIAHLFLGITFLHQ